MEQSSSAERDLTLQVFVNASEKSLVWEGCWWCYNDRQRLSRRWCRRRCRFFSCRRWIFKAHDEILRWSHRTRVHSSWSKLFLLLGNNLLPLIGPIIIPTTRLFHSRFWSLHVARSQSSQQIRVQIAQISRRRMNIFHVGVIGWEIHKRPNVQNIVEFVSIGL